MASSATPAVADPATAVVKNEPLLVTLRTNPVFLRLQSLVMWEKVLHTSLVVWIVNVFVFLIAYGDYSVVTLLSYLLSIFVLLCGGAVLFTAARNHFRHQNNPNPIAARFGSGQIGVSRQTVGHALEIAMLLWNAFIEQARDIVCFERPLRSLKWVLVLYLLGLVGGCLSGITVLYLLFCVAFMWPRLYREKYVVIDAQLAKVSAQYDAIYAKIVAKVPPNVRQHLKLD